MACSDLRDTKQVERRGDCRPRSASRVSTISHLSTQLLKGPAGVKPFEGYTTVYGSFTTTASAADRLRASLEIQIPITSGNGNYGFYWDDDTPPDSPLPFGSSGPRRSPSITRTFLPPDSSRDKVSADPAFLIKPSTPLAETQKLHPVLDALEKGSRVSKQSQCATCLNFGRDFPCCGRCGQTWCSRQCRLQGSKWHICPAPRH